MALGKALTCSALSLSSPTNVALETVPMFVWLHTDRSRLRKWECRPPPFSIPLSFRRAMLWSSGLSAFRKFLKPLNTSALPSCRPDVIFAVFASLAARSFPLSHAQSRRSTEFFAVEDCLVMCQSGHTFPDSTFCRRFPESVKMMACVICASC